MMEFLRRLWVVFRKEMTHCYRDPHVVIYGVLFPLLFYPATAIVMLEVGIFQEGKREKEIYRVVFPESKDANVNAIRELVVASKRVKLVESAVPQKDLKDGNIEAFVQEIDGNLSVKVAGSMPLSETAHTFLTKLIERRRLKNIRAELTDRKIPLEIMRVFTFELKDSRRPQAQKDDNKGGDAVHVIFRYLLASVICVLVLCIPAGAVYPAICAFTEEREKKTLESTLVAAVNTEILMAGKFLSVFFVAFMSGLLNLVGMSLVIWLLLSQAKELSSLSKLSGASFQVSPETIICLISATTLFSLLVSAMFSLLGACTKSFKEAQNMLTIPLLIFTPMPIAGMLPGVLLSKPLAFVPVLNLILWVKSAVRGDMDPMLVSITVIETLFLSAFMLYMLSRLIRTEKFVLGDQVNLLTPVFARGKANGS
ncbi:MAG: ABC transporter permease [Candidatus Melainabacteria bacterium]|jgi:ABC-type Na+ efflux pump permease subunit|nr:ABC transporter permease [Candidatus Melainabacteria bacterium]